MPSEIICTSKLYPAEKSWTKSPAWWIEIPITKLYDSKFSEIHILCQFNEAGFHHLKVPKTFIIENLGKLAMVREEKVSIWPSARSEDMFTDLRGHGRIDFSQWLQE
jgi:hypothetical protein